MLIPLEIICTILVIIMFFVATLAILYISAGTSGVGVLIWFIIVVVQTLIIAPVALGLLGFTYFYCKDKKLKNDSKFIIIELIMAILFTIIPIVAYFPADLYSKHLHKQYRIQQKAEQIKTEQLKQRINEYKNECIFYEEKVTPNGLSVRYKGNCSGKNKNKN